MGLSSTGLISVTFPFDPVTNAELRQIRPRGIWRGVSNGWEFPLSAGECLTKQFGSRFSIQKELAQWLLWFKSPLPPLPSHRHLVRSADLETVLSDGRQPFLHQKTGARWLMARRGAVLADEMGLGKTLTALLAARAMVRSVEVKVMVIAPLSVHSHW